MHYYILNTYTHIYHAHLEKKNTNTLEFKHSKIQIINFNTFFNLKLFSSLKNFIIIFENIQT